MVRPSLCCRDSPGSTPGEDTLPTGVSNAVAAAAAAVADICADVDAADDVQVEVGVGGSSLSVNPSLLSHVWVSIALLFLLPHILPLPNLLRPSSLCLCLHPPRDALSFSLSLSLSHYSLSLSLAIPSR